MERSRFLELLGAISEEDLYRRLYCRNPQAFEQPVKSWEEFCARFSEGECEETALPADPPTQIADILTEKDFFAPEWSGEVSVVVNARYCPAFLHELEFIKIIYVFRGRCRFFFDGKWTEMTEGNVCIVAPGVEQSVFSCHDEDIVLNLLLRRSTFADAFSELLEVREGDLITDFFWRMLMGKPGGDVMLFDGEPQPLLEEGVMELYEEVLLQPVKSGLITRSIMLAIVAYIMRWDERRAVSFGKKHRKGQENYALAQYVQYMKRNLSTVTLSGLASAFYVSEGYLSRYFKRETGETFSRMLLDMRMKRAARLLVSTECSMAKIIELTGYTDQSIFYRNFKAAYGMTPSVYRRKHERIF